jgi:hypothetical protein
MRIHPGGALVLDYQSKNELYRKAREDDWMNMSSTRVVGGSHGGRKSIDGTLLDRFVNEFRGNSNVIILFASVQSALL